MNCRLICQGTRSPYINCLEENNFLKAILSLIYCFAIEFYTNLKLTCEEPVFHHLKQACGCSKVKHQGIKHNICVLLVAYNRWSKHKWDLLTPSLIFFLFSPSSHLMFLTFFSLHSFKICVFLVYWHMICVCSDCKILCTKLGTELFHN